METSKRLEKFAQDSGLFKGPVQHNFVDDVYFGTVDPALIRSIPKRDDLDEPFPGCDVVDHVLGGKKFWAEAALTDEAAFDNKARDTARMVVSTLLEQAVFDAYDQPSEIPGPDGGKLYIEREVGISLAYTTSELHPKDPWLTVRLLLRCARV